MPYTHILVAVDLTEECREVIQRAQALANSSNAKLSLINVVEPMAMAFGGDVPMDLSMLQQQQFDQARERLDSFAKGYPELTPEQRHLAYGQPRQEIRLDVEMLSKLAFEVAPEEAMKHIDGDVGLKRLIQRRMAEFWPEAFTAG